MASNNRLLSALPEVEERVEWVRRPGQAPITTTPVHFLPGSNTSREAVGGIPFRQNTYQPPWSLIANSNRHLSGGTLKMLRA